MVVPNLGVVVPTGPCQLALGIVGVSGGAGDRVGGIQLLQKGDIPQRIVGIAPVQGSEDPGPGLRGGHGHVGYQPRGPAVVERARVGESSGRRPGLGGPKPSQRRVSGQSENRPMIDRPTQREPSTVFMCS